MSEPKPRNQSIDALKGIAIIAVILLHLPASPTTETVYWQLLDILSRFAVPCFFLVSGYFFQKSWSRAENKTQLIIRSALRIIPIFLFWAMFYVFVPPFLDGSDWKHHLQAILRYPHSFVLTGNIYHLWFLSSLLQGLLILWISLRLNRFWLGLTFGILLFAISLVAGTYSMTPLGVPISFDMKNGPFFSTLFVFLGAVLAQDRCRLQNGIAIASAISGFLLCIAEISFLDRVYGVPFRGTSVMLGTIPLAVGIINLALNGSLHVPSLAFIGRYSLGIYVIHPWFITIFETFGTQKINAIPIFLLFLILSFSLLFTWLSSKFNILKNIIT